MAKKNGTVERKPKAGAAKGRAARAVEISAWEDDPGQMPALTPINRPVPNLTTGPLNIQIRDTAPPPALYPPGTSEFRYWAAADALQRGLAFWRNVVPRSTKWSLNTAYLPANLNAGVALNALYSRGEAPDQPGLSFFYDSVNGTTVFAGESPDIVCHELGHAILDAVKPQLWNAMSDEVAAFHESFGDISAILSALQLPSIRQAVLAETDGRLYRASRLSRLGEQLGWAMRQRDPNNADPDCLRNAVNSFFYRDPQTLPPEAPASLLSTEPHSFSRVFTAAFYEALAGMFKIHSSTANEADLLNISLDAGKLLIRAVTDAPVVPNFYAQVGAQLVLADEALFNRKYRDVLKGAFVRRGILSLETAATITNPQLPVAPPVARTAARTATELPKAPFFARKYGLKTGFLAHIPQQERRINAFAASNDLGALEPPTTEKSAESFIEDLFRRGRVDYRDYGDPDTQITQPLIRKTHVLADDAGGVLMKRRMFDCGFD